MTRQRLLLASLLAVWVSMVLACGGGQQSGTPPQDAKAAPAQSPSEPVSNKLLAEGNLDKPLALEPVGKVILNPLIGQDYFLEHETDTNV